MKEIIELLKTKGWSDELIAAFFKDIELETKDNDQQFYREFYDSNSLAVDFSLNSNSTKLVFSSSDK